MVDKYFIFKYQLDLYKLLQLQFVVFINDIYFMLCFFFSFFFLPVWALLFGQTLSRSGWQRRSSLGPSWFFCSPHRQAKTVCSPHCTQTSGTPGKLSVRLWITEDSKQLSAQHIYSKLVCVQPEETLTFTTEDLVHRLAPGLNILQRILGEATQSTLEKSIKIYH